MIDLDAIRSEARRQIATEGHVKALETIAGLDQREELQALDAILDVLSEHLRQLKASTGERPEAGDA